MQIPSIPPPVITNMLPQDIATKAVSSPQAVAPLIQTAITPTPKAEKFLDARRDRSSKQSREEKGKLTDDEDEKKGGHSINMSI
ncbi:MAG: hypothetical protein PHW76_02305 [Alphaproteobacteria bacterium]|nr:hypothetical protein [Alphaproteobacteria bacterium]